ncbi:MAG TPA: dTMP kinase [Burkholderiaceae bacterium]|nr:dTMP kinase [Burkholderiaceae bacterium]
MNRARFVTFEGIDGAGKSSHIDWYVERLAAAGIGAVRTREPGGTALAEQIRQWLLERPMSADTEVLLAFAARDDHLRTVIRPTLADGRWVVCDRFTDSTFAYQGAGRGVSTAQIERLVRWIHPDLQPDRTYLFDLDPVEAARRRAAVRPADRFETEDAAFFARVRDGYLDRQRMHPDRFVRIDGSLSLQAIRALLEEDLLKLCQK